MQESVQVSAQVSVQELIQAHKLSVDSVNKVANVNTSEGKKIEAHLEL